jgi:hypothetical protein
LCELEPEALADLNHQIRSASASGSSHFWYRFAPDGPAIYSQRENKAFRFAEVPDSRFSHPFRMHGIMLTLSVVRLSPTTG